MNALIVAIGLIVAIASFAAGVSLGIGVVSRHKDDQDLDNLYDEAKKATTPDELTAVEQKLAKLKDISALRVKHQSLRSYIQGRRDSMK